MILVAGGQLDPSIGALLRRLTQRRVAFVDLLVGPNLVPDLTIDLKRNVLRLNGQTIRPTACFMRYDVFLQMQSHDPAAHRATQNWYAAIKGWELADGDVRGFNKGAIGSDSNKFQNLALARSVGFDVPDTLVTNQFAGLRRAKHLIQKPTVGGEYTVPLDAWRKNLDPKDRIAAYPRFVQNRLKRPELRVYRIGRAFFGFHLHSDDVDYRERNRVRLDFVAPPPDVVTKLRALTDRLRLDFAAADLMPDAKGRLHFLEVNSQPMFAAFDAVAGGALCDAIIDHLSPPRRPQRR